MARKCQISGVSRQYGHRVSHAKNKTKHVFLANIQTKRIFVPEQNKFITLRLSTRMLRTIDRLGLAATLKKHRMELSQLL